MKTYVKERCTNPRAFYQTAQDVIEDDVLGPSEKELALKTMAAQVELIDDVEVDEVLTVGDHPPELLAIHNALSDLGEPHGFPDQNSDKPNGTEEIDHIVVAFSGNSEVDKPVCAAACKVAKITGAHVHFVNVITHVTDPAEYGALGPVGSATVAPHVGIRELDAERAQRKEEFAEFARHCELPKAYSVEVRTGIADEEIVQAANKGDASLIVVGSCEKTWLDGILSTDVAREVTSKAKRPVLVVPEAGHSVA